jgi:uncharacterized protein (DUF2141 family)
MNGRRALDAALVALAIVSPAVSNAEGTATLTVQVTGALPGKGQAVFSLFTSKENFLREPYTTMTTPVDSNGKAVFHVKELKPGTYAVSVYHDADNNGELNTGLFGVPTELVGFSNQARSLFGPPSFRKAAFQIANEKEIGIRLGKAKD